MRTRPPTAPAVAAIILVIGAGALAGPATAGAATLVGGHRQAAIRRAFAAQPAHRRQAIVSIRASTVSPAWAVVRSVTPQSGRPGSGAVAPRLQTTYFHSVRGAERGGSPRPAVRSDLDQDFRVEVVYTGSGGESIAYHQEYRSACAGDGSFSDVQTATVSPMSWSVRYAVDLDDLLAAVRTAQGTVLVPNVTFDYAGSRLNAVENLGRTIVDTGCNGTPTTFTCRTTFGLGGSNPAGRLTFVPGSGIQVGLPVATSAGGACNPDYYTLGPSLWDSGASTALVGTLGLMGGNLPANPYAPIHVSWPAGSAQQSRGFAASPCQGDGSVCGDDFHWSATVALQRVPGG